MTIDKAIALLQSLTYKPHWKLKVTYSEADDLAYLRLKVKTECTRTGEMVQFATDTKIAISPYCNRPLQFDTGEAELLQAVRQWIHELELHEADEWLQVDGKMVFDPHPVPYKPGRSYVEATPAGHRLQKV